MIAVPMRGVTLRDWLAWYHLLAGAIGMVVTIIVAPAVVERMPADGRVTVQLLFLSMAALFAGVAVVGVALFYRARSAPLLATVCQALQVPVFIARSFQWTFFAGAYTVPYWQRGAGFSADIGLKANLQLSWAAATDPTLIGVNVVPFVIIWLLLRKLPSVEALQLESGVSGQFAPGPNGNDG